MVFSFTIIGRIIDIVLYNERSRIKYHNLDLDFSKVTEIEKPAGACLLARANLLIEENYLIDPYFPFFFNDDDLCKRIYKKQYKIFLLPHISVIHDRGSAFKKSNSMWARQEFIMSQIKYFRKYHNQEIKKLKMILLLDSLTRFVLAPIKGLYEMAKGIDTKTSFLEEMLNEITICRIIYCEKFNEKRIKQNRAFL